MYTVYGDIESGNCYKIKLLMSLLDIEHHWQHIDILKGESKTPEFLSINPNGKIPVLHVSGDSYLTESNAILFYLSEGSAYLPSDRLPSDALARARVLEWMFFEQYSHEPYIAVARYIKKYLGLPEARIEEYESKQQGGHKALRILEKQLQSTPFLVGDAPSIADISLYAYTHVAEQGGFELSGYSGIKTWLTKIQALPGYISMNRRVA